MAISREAADSTSCDGRDAEAAFTTGRAPPVGLSASGGIAGDSGSVTVESGAGASATPAAAAEGPSGEDGFKMAGPGAGRGDPEAAHLSK
ncbi:unnamed protein product [Linum trigynum]|uniref:Uncharacterized protein n=1 Tax=Linum trigynum TaxID=586398 RepID=A0AAV2EWG7_9ROSI